MTAISKIIWALAAVLPVSAAAAGQQSTFGSMSAQTMHHAQGTFDVKMTPAPAAGKGGIGQMSIDKQFHGDLDGHSMGEMLYAGSPASSGGYVAIERVTGTLAGRSGGFVLQHSGTMDNGVPSLSVTVVPDSGTDGLKGLTGKMQINIENGKHFYDFEYSLP